MTALDRALGWFVAPAPPAAPPAGRRRRKRPARTAGATLVDPGSARAAAASASGAEAPPASAAAAYAGTARAAAASVSGVAASSQWSALAVDEAELDREAARASWAALFDGGEAAGAPVVTSAAVLGRPRDVEPVAAALALALRRETRARAAAVAVVGPGPLEPGGEGGAAAARRLVARLEGHGLTARVRGRLAWVGLDPLDPQLVAAARRVTLVAAPAVLAVSSPRNAAIDAALAEQDLLVLVGNDPEGPLAQLAADGLSGIPTVHVRPLQRGPARALARAGLRAPRAARYLLPPTGVQHR